MLKYQKFVKFQRKRRNLVVTKNGNVDAKKLTDFTTKALQKVGVPAEDAQITARILVVPGLRGLETHGVANLPGYIRGGGYV